MPSYLSNLSSCTGFECGRKQAFTSIWRARKHCMHHAVHRKYHTLSPHYCISLRMSSSKIQTQNFNKNILIQMVMMKLHAIKQLKKPYFCKCWHFSLWFHLLQDLQGSLGIVCKRCFIYLLNFSFAFTQVYKTIKETKPQEMTAACSSLDMPSDCIPTFPTRYFCFFSKFLILISTYSFPKNI